MSDEWEARKPVPAKHEIGTDLAAISVDELADRIALLQAEIARLEAEIAKKRASRDQAAGVFRF